MDGASGWPNKADRWAKEAIEYLADTLPYPIIGIDSDNGGEFINHQLADWSITRKIGMTRSQPHMSKDNPHMEQINAPDDRVHSLSGRPLSPANWLFHF